MNSHTQTTALSLIEDNADKFNNKHEALIAHGLTKRAYAEMNANDNMRHTIVDTLGQDRHKLVDIIKINDTTFIVELDDSFAKFRTIVMKLNEKPRKLHQCSDSLAAQLIITSLYLVNNNDNHQVDESFVLPAMLRLANLH